MKNWKISAVVCNKKSLKLHFFHISADGNNLLLNIKISLYDEKKWEERRKLEGRKIYLMSMHTIYILEAFECLQNFHFMLYMYNPLEHIFFLICFSY